MGRWLGTPLCTTEPGGLCKPQPSQRQADIAERRYRVGVTSALEWIEACQQLAALEAPRLAAMQQLANNAAALLKALCGGVGGE